MLGIQRRVPNEQPDSFAISTAEQMIEDFHRITGVVALVMVILSSIRLLVGGIRVMNIMLVSVNERTREIGIHQGRAQERHHRAIPDRGGGAHRHRRSDRPVDGLERLLLTTGLIFKNLPPAVPTVGGRVGDSGAGRRGAVLRDMAGGTGGESRSSGGAAV